MKPYYQNKWVTIYHGDCRDLTFEGISAIVTDPPYELGFMGKAWDSKGVSFQEEAWEHLRKSCLPGSPLLSFGGTRTFHRIACAIEDAGWEIRDTICWVYGSGFPKSLDISKAIDYDACREQLTEKLGRKPTKDELKEAWKQFRKVVGQKECGYQVSISKTRMEQGYRPNLTTATEECDVTTPATPEAQLWEGYGTALKPAYEPILVCMNPLDGTFAENALKHKVAGLNIDECRVGTKERETWSCGSSNYKVSNAEPWRETKHKIIGRFPANFIHDGSDEVLELFPNSKPTKPHKVYSNIAKYEGYGSITQKHGEVINYDETEGSAARFFYCAKASRSERDAGLEGIHYSEPTEMTGRKQGSAGLLRIRDDGSIGENPYAGKSARAKNSHPTVKPLALMEYLCKLVKMPEYNLILDPFCGSGTTLLACRRLGIKSIGVDSDEQACEIAAKRCSQMIQEVMDLSHS